MFGAILIVEGCEGCDVTAHQGFSNAPDLWLSKSASRRGAEYGVKAQSRRLLPVQRVGRQRQRQWQRAPSGNNVELMMQNGVFLHTKEDINTGCLRTPLLITLFKITADVA